MEPTRDDDVLTPDDFHMGGNPLTPPEPPPAPTPEPTEPSWVSYPRVAQHVQDGTLYADIINHYKGKLHYPDKMTDAHETTHMVNADIRNQHGNGVVIVGFYVGGDRAIFMDQPKMRKSSIAQFVPHSLQESRYGVYITGQREWDDSPLYPFDEWIAYVNGGAVCVEQVEAGTYKDGWTDGVMGLLEFSVYCTATVQAIEKNDPDFLARTPEFLKYTGWCLKRASDVYAKGSVMEQFKWDKMDRYLDTWRTSSQAADLRSILERHFGGVWLK